MSNTLPHLLAGISGPSEPLQPQQSTSSPAPAHEASKHAFTTGPRKSVVTNMLKSVSARRRAGTNELAHLKKAKRSLPAKRAVAVRAGTFTAEFRLPGPQRKSAPENDVEMKDVEEEEERREAKVSITLPARLGRPKFKRVPIEKALFMNEALKDVPIEYIQDELARKGQKCVYSLVCGSLSLTVVTLPDCSASSNTSPSAHPFPPPSLERSRSRSRMHLQTCPRTCSPSTRKTYPPALATS